MKRLTFIYWAAPLLLGLTALPPFFAPPWSLLAAAALACVLWGVLWLRLYGSKRLRPEFSLAGILAPLSAQGLHALQQMNAEAAEPFAATFWQNLHFVLWLGVCWVGITALLPDEPGKSAWKDPVTLFMSIILILYAVSRWAAESYSLFLPAQQ